MASIIKEVVIDADPDDVWAAVQDFGALHERLVPGFVVDCHLNGSDVRTVTFFNGATAREVLIGVDVAARRLTYSVTDSPFGFTHNNASAQVLLEGEHQSRFIWITDLLPDELASPIAELMERGIAVIKTTLESPAVLG